MENLVYFVLGTLKGTAEWENHQEKITARGLVKLQDVICEALRTEHYSDDLAQWIDEEYKDFVKSIKPGTIVIDGQLYSYTEVQTTRPLTGQEKEDVLEYIKGQFSDGWGEGFEQYDVGNDSFEQTTVEFDPDTLEFYTEEQKVHVNYYVHFYQSCTEGFELWFEKQGEPCIFTGRICDYFEEEENIKRCICPREQMPCRQ